MTQRLAVLALVLSAAGARAADAPKEADALFARARAFLKADQPAEACPLLEQSFALDPALGTLMNLADCFERIGKLGSAYVHFNEAMAWAARTHEAGREVEARKRAAAVKPRLSWLTISVEAPSPVGLTVRVNAASLALGTLAQSVPVDSGDVTVQASAPGFETFVQHLGVAASATVAFKVPMLRASGGDLKSPSLDSASGVPSIPPNAIVARAPLPARPTVAGPAVLAIAGAAVTAVAIGGLAWSYSTYGNFQAQQPGGSQSGDPTVSRGTFNTSHSIYTAAWVGAGVGTAALVAALGWWLVGRASSSFLASLGSSSSAFAFGGAP